MGNKGPLPSVDMRPPSMPRSTESLHRLGSIQAQLHVVRHDADAVGVANDFNFKPWVLQQPCMKAFKSP